MHVSRIWRSYDLVDATLRGGLERVVQPVGPAARCVVGQVAAMVADGDVASDRFRRRSGIPRLREHVEPDASIVKRIVAFEGRIALAVVHGDTEPVAAVPIRDVVASLIELTEGEEARVQRESVLAIVLRDVPGDLPRPLDAESDPVPDRSIPDERVREVDVESGVVADRGVADERAPESTARNPV